MLWAYTVIYVTSNLDKGVRLFKAQIVSDNIKEFIDTIAPIVDEAKMKIGPNGITIKAVDPSHVAMIETTLNSGAFNNLEAEEAELGIDVTKFKSVIGVAKSGEMIDIERNMEMNSLIISIGNLIRAMPLLDMTGMADPKVPNLDLPTVVKVKAEEVSHGLKASKMVSDHIELSANEESFRLVCKGENQNRVDLTMNRTQLDELKAPNDTASLFSLDYFSLMINSVKNDRIMTISLGNDLPVKIEAELAMDENTGAQGSVRFLLAPRIDRD